MSNLVWIDLEMTGLNHLNEFIIEAALVITDPSLNILAQTPSYAIYQPDAVLDRMDEWNLTTHTKSGLLHRVVLSKYTVLNVESLFLNLIKYYSKPNTSPLCGSTIYHDRKFIAKFMPALNNYLHYHVIDVSSIRELAKKWYPDIITMFTKNNEHNALSDILESIQELCFYRKNIFI